MDELSTEQLQEMYDGPCTDCIEKQVLGNIYIALDMHIMMTDDMVADGESCMTISEWSPIRERLVTLRKMYDVASD